jgi:hypothetical protein
MSQQQQPLFGWHEAEQALVFFAAKGVPVGITVTDLQQHILGWRETPEGDRVPIRWHVTAEGLRASLPRTDAPLVIRHADPLLQKALDQTGGVAKHVRKRLTR